MFNKLRHVALAERYVNRIHLISIAALLLSTSGCMYPGMDYKAEKLGTNTAQTLASQVAYPENEKNNGDEILSRTDGEKAKLILENHRRNVSTADDLEKPINININGGR